MFIVSSTGQERKQPWSGINKRGAVLKDLWEEINYRLCLFSNELINRILTEWELSNEEIGALSIILREW